MVTYSCTFWAEVLIFQTVVFIFILETKRFGCCILWPSSGVSYLSGHRNDLTWEIIFKVGLLISQVESFPCPAKQGIPEEGWRIQRPKHYISTTNKIVLDNSLKNHKQNNTYEASSKKNQRVYHIYPTPPLGQDMTQDQFFKRSLTRFNSEFSFF